MRDEEEATPSLVGLNSAYSPEKCRKGFLFHWIDEQLSTGKEEVTKELLENYLALIKHYYDSEVKVFEDYPNLFGKSFYALEREVILDALTAPQSGVSHVSNGGPSEGLSADQGFRDFVSHALELITGNISGFVFFLVLLTGFEVALTYYFGDKFVIFGWPANVFLIMGKLAIFICCLLSLNRVAQSMQNNTKQFFLELEHNLNHAVEEAKAIGGRGKKVIKVNQELAASAAKFAMFAAKRVEFGMRWIAVEIFAFRLTLTASSAVSAVALIAIGSVGAISVILNDGNGFGVRAALGVSLLVTGYMWWQISRYLQAGLKSRMRTADWVTFDEIAIADKIGEIIKGDKERVFGAGPNPGQEDEITEIHWKVD